MTSFKELSIKSKLTWVIMLTSCLALLSAGAAFVTHHLIASRAAMEVELSRLVDIIGTTSASSLTLGMPIGAENALTALRIDNQIVAACLYKDGKIFAKFPADRPDAAFPKAVEPDSHKFENHVLTLTRPVLDPDHKQLGTIFIQASLNKMFMRLRRDVVIVLIVLLAAATVALIISSRLQRVISKPILQ